MIDAPHDDGFDANDPARSLAPARTRDVVGALALGALGLAVLFALGFAPRRHRRKALAEEAEAVGREPVVVSVARPRPSSGAIDVTLPGTVRAFQETWIYARTNGYVKRRLADIGDVVSAGQLLAEIDVPELDQELAQAKAALVQIRARRSLSKAQLALAESTLKRFEAVGAAGGIAQQELDEKQASLEVARASAEAAQADVAAAEANVRRLEKLHEFSQVTAPFAGTIAARTVDTGSLVTAGNGQAQTLFHLVQTNPARITVSVPQSLAPAIKVDSPAELTFREFPGRTFTGKVTRTTGSIDDVSRTLLAQVEVPNDDGRLLAGMYTQVVFHAARDHATFLIPQSALVVGAAGVQVVTVKGGIARFQDVVIDCDYGTELSILRGVGADDLVVTNPGEKLVVGVAVEVVEAKPDAPAKTEKVEAAARPGPAKKTD